MWRGASALRFYTRDVALDPVCGMTIDPARAAGQFEHDGTTYYFCSKGCLAKFAADPQKYLTGTREPMVHPPSRPEAASAGQVQPVISIGGLKKASSPISTDVASGISRTSGPPEGGPHVGSRGAEYTCPMHPEIVRDGPGACPICGMALEPRTFSLTDEPNPELIDMMRRLWMA